MGDQGVLGRSCAQLASGGVGEEADRVVAAPAPAPAGNRDDAAGLGTDDPQG